ncbi:thiamine-phosphate kinase [Dehalogenimonas alkenigignens]|uniref:Thiamine-monophosphate kinase n=1 Tax=Dehalogenimonas alkenigignens TaxID=1217799 RepID=A0A0W0GHN3_9CHLR|nr:thiamine-phosphate kinase [Dehalogenimonas alkenigignens]KTB48058.1 thiamine-phosphate kinase [Dehalogenimonas alkenigignens]PVV84311.1 thiamine-phosphate kinase [Dehalogenimonas alkenigignens]
MKASKTGEFGLIDRIIEEIKKVEPGDWDSLISGIGDDAALIEFKSKYQLATTDSLIEDIHFEMNFLDWEALGWKALAVNLSDIAAMGGTPKYALVSLNLPASTDFDDVVRLYRGMLQLAKASGTIISGGNISRAEKLAVHVTAVGEAAGKSKTLLRGGARNGDLIAVTGILGGAAAALETPYRSINIDRQDAEALKKAFWRPQPRLQAGKVMVKHGIRCAIDISDGLLADLSHILEASGTGARIEASKIPVNPAAAATCGTKSLELALTGGEDYELLFTGKSGAIKKVAIDAGCPVTVIGKMTRHAGKLEVIDGRGRRMNFEGGGWRHF